MVEINEINEIGYSLSVYEHIKTLYYGIIGSVSNGRSQSCEKVNYNNNCFIRSIQLYTLPNLAQGDVSILALYYSGPEYYIISDLVKTGQLKTYY